MRLDVLVNLHSSSFSVAFTMPPTSLHLTFRLPDIGYRLYIVSHTLKCTEAADVSVVLIRLCCSYLTLQTFSRSITTVLNAWSPVA